jgi:hypothetical protein
MMFFQVFLTAYTPVAVIILTLLGEWLKQVFLRLRGHARPAPANRRRTSPSNDWSKGQPGPAGAIAFAHDPRRRTNGPHAELIDGSQYAPHAAVTAVKTLLSHRSE